MTVASCLAAQLATFPAAGRSILAEVIGDPGFRGVVPAPVVDALAPSIGGSVADLLLLLVPFAQCYAAPPVSDFPVGVVAQGESGSVYFGANMEVAGTALGFTVHGEQSATTNAWLNGEQGLTAIAVSSAPCGSCRQFLNELTTASTLTVLIDGGAPARLADLLPQAFGPSDLGVSDVLMSPQSHGLAIDPAPSDPIVLAALAAADASYAPYSRGYAGVALRTASGGVYTGRYAENAAFNPSLSPLGSALAMWSLGGDTGDALIRAVLVEAPSKVDHAAAARALLGAIADVGLEVYEARS